MERGPPHARRGEKIFFSAAPTVFRKFAVSEGQLMSEREFSDVSDQLSAEN
jgi:hypothetical protein